MSKRHVDFREVRTPERIEKVEKVLNHRQSDLTIVLENLYDPHNVSAVYRSCDAVGIFDIYLVYDGTQAFPKLGAKSSASARKWVNTQKFNTIKACYKDLRSQGKKIYTTHMSEKAGSLYSLDLTQPTALVFGNEQRGVSEEALKQADGNFLIPQVGMLQSLNISVACAVSVFEAFRQRLEAGFYDKPQLSQEIMDTHMEKWLGVKPKRR